jgi:hypothetical protein
MLLELNYYYENNKLNLTFSIYKDIELFSGAKFYIEREIKNWYDRKLEHKHYIILNSELGIYIPNFDYRFFQFDILIGFSYRSALASGGKNPREYDRYNIYTTLFFNQ